MNMNKKIRKKFNMNYLKGGFGYDRFFYDVLIVSNISPQSMRGHLKNLEPVIKNVKS